MGTVGSIGIVCGWPGSCRLGSTGISGLGPPTHTQVTLTSIGVENGGSHLGVLGGVSGTHFQPLPLLTHMLCGHAGSERISGSRQNGDAGNSAHPTEGRIGGAVDWLGIGMTPGGELVVGSALALALDDGLGCAARAG